MFPTCPCLCLSLSFSGLLLSLSPFPHISHVRTPGAHPLAAFTPPLPPGRVPAHTERLPVGWQRHTNPSVQEEDNEKCPKCLLPCRDGFCPQRVRARPSQKKQPGGEIGGNTLGSGKSWEGTPKSWDSNCWAVGSSRGHNREGGEKFNKNKAR